VESALVQYEEALRLKPGLAIARRRYARLLAQAERFEEAVTHVRRAIQDDPYDPSGPYQNGLTLFIAGHAKDTIALLEPVIARRPDDSYAVHDLSDAYAWLGSQATGTARAEYFRKAFELADRETNLEREMRADPRIRTPWGDKMHAHFYSLQGHYKQAERFLGALWKICRTARCLLSWSPSSSRHKTGRRKPSICWLKPWRSAIPIRFF